MNELIELLEYQAEIINEKFENHIHTDRFLEKFNELHREPIKALKEGQTIVSYEILNKIHSLINQYSDISDELDIVDYCCVTNTIAIE